MTTAIAGTAAALVTAIAGLSLVSIYLVRRSAPRALLVGHPLVGMVALSLVYVAVVGWQGPRNLPLDAGAVVLALVFLGGVLLFALRLNRLPQPFFVVALHGGAALFSCVLLVIGLLHGLGGA